MTRIYPKRKIENAHLDRRWKLQCELAYDGGGSYWEKGYRTKLGARIAAFYHYHIASWGGSIEIIDQRKE